MNKQPPLENQKRNPKINQNESNERSEKKSEAKKGNKKTSYGFFVNISIVILVPFVLIAVAMAIGFTPLNNISVQGNHLYNTQNIVEVSGLKIGGNSMKYKLDKAEKDIVRELPYIRSADIKRTFGGVLINITELEAKYALWQNSGYILLSDDFKVLEIGADKIPNDVFKISGLDATGISAGSVAEIENSSGAEILGTVISLISKVDFKGITEINVSDVSNIELTYRDRMRISLGNEDNLEYKLLFAKETVKQEDLNDPSQRGSLNLGKLGEAHFIPYMPTTAPYTRPVITTTAPASTGSETTAAPASDASGTTEPATVNNQ